MESNDNKLTWLLLLARHHFKLFMPINISKPQNNTLLLIFKYSHFTNKNKETRAVSQVVMLYLVSFPLQLNLHLFFKVAYFGLLKHSFDFNRIILIPVISISLMESLLYLKNYLLIFCIFITRQKTPYFVNYNVFP